MKPPANANAPIVELRAAGNAAALYRALARVLVRRELISVKAISEQDNCAPIKAAG